MGAVLSTYDDSRLRVWQAALLAVVVAIAVGLIRPGASWGSPAYNPSSDRYSMQNITAGAGVGGRWGR